jgi:hypothetical protein
MEVGINGSVTTSLPNALAPVPAQRSASAVPVHQVSRAAADGPAGRQSAPGTSPETTAGIRRDGREPTEDGPVRTRGSYCADPAAQVAPRFWAGCGHTGPHCIRITRSSKRSSEKSGEMTATSMSLQGRADPTAWEPYRYAASTHSRRRTIVRTVPPEQVYQEAPLGARPPAHRPQIRL